MTDRCNGLEHCVFFSEAVKPNFCLFRRLCFFVPAHYLGHFLNNYIAGIAQSIL